MAETTPNGKVEATSASPAKTTAKKKGAGKIVVLGCVLVACAVIALCIIGTAVAFFSNRNIPLFSSLVEKGENLSTTKDQRAQMVQDDMKDFVFSTILSQKQDKENALVNVTATEDQINDLIKDKTDVKSARYSGELSMTGSSSSMTMNVTMDGIYNDSALTSNLDGNIKAQGMTISMKGELRSVNNNMYLKFSEFPSAILGLTSSSALQDQWITIPNSGATSLAGSLNSSLAAEENSTITNEDLNKVKQFIDSDEMSKNIERIDDQVIHGVRTNCFKMDLNATDLRALQKRAAIINGDAVDEKAINASVDDGEALLLTMCSGRVDGQIYKIDLSMTTVTPASSTSPEQTQTVGLKLELWDYNRVSDKVSAPSDAMPMEQVIQQLMYGSSMNGLLESGLD